jgi:hypothetical protein
LSTSSVARFALNAARQCTICIDSSGRRLYDKTNACFDADRTLAGGASVLAKRLRVRAERMM